ncbi:MAG: metallophosphoesterase [Candidatus Aenigmatarchaeota archaeon]
MKFVKNFACIYLEKIKSIVIGDLHIGIEEELKKEGINVAYTEKVIEDIKKCKEKTEANKIILLGDTKNSIGIPEKRTEIKLLEKFFEFLNSEFKKVYLVKGNHDGMIEKLVNSDKIKIYTSRGFKIKRYGFLHGNAYPLQKVMKANLIFCSHAHPKVSLYLNNRKVEDIRVYSIFRLKEFFGKNKKLIIIPPFSSLIGGKEIEEILKEKSIISKLVDENSLEIISIDGIKIL